MSALHTPLAGGKVPDCAGTVVGAPDADTRVQFLLTVRSRNLSRGLGWVNRLAWLPPAQRTVLTREMCAEIHGAADEDLDTVRACLAAWSIDCTAVDAAQRLVRAIGPVASVERAFGITLELHASGDELAAPQSAHVGRRGVIHLPPRMVGVVRAVAGLDECTRLRPFVQQTPAKWDPTAANLQSAWDLPQGLTGAGVCVAVTAPADGLDAAQLRAAGLPADVTVLGGDAGSMPINSGDWATATVAQVHAVRVVAPAARVVVHLGAGGETGAVEVLSGAIHDAVNAPQVVLAGWGAPEAEWSRQAMVALEQRFLIAASMGVTVVCATPCDAAIFPATAPHALACAPGSAAGGASGSTVVSGLFPGPLWQQAIAGGDGAADVAARVLPDVTAPSAVPLSGAAGSVNGAAISAALCAGLTAALAQAAGAPLGLLAPLLAHRTNSHLEPDVGALLDLLTQVPLVPPTTRPPAGSRAHPAAIAARRTRQ